jgi:hypothetical protein
MARGPDTQECKGFRGPASPRPTPRNARGTHPPHAPHTRTPCPSSAPATVVQRGARSWPRSRSPCTRSPGSAYGGATDAEKSVQETGAGRQTSGNRCREQARGTDAGTGAGKQTRRNRGAGKRARGNGGGRQTSGDAGNSSGCCLFLPRRSPAPLPAPIPCPRSLHQLPVLTPRLFPALPRVRFPAPVPTRSLPCAAFPRRPHRPSPRRPHRPSPRRPCRPSPRRPCRPSPRRLRRPSPHRPRVCLLRPSPCSQ